MGIGGEIEKKVGRGIVDMNIFEAIVDDTAHWLTHAFGEVFDENAVAGFCGIILEGGEERFTWQIGLRREAGACKESGEEVEEGGFRLDRLVWGNLWTSEDERDTDGGFPPGTFEPHVVFSEHFAVVGGQNDEGILIMLEAFKFFDQFTDFVVEV